MVDTNLVKEFYKRLKKLAKNAKEGEHEIGEILEHLEAIKKPSLALLSETKIGIPVQVSSVVRLVVGEVVPLS